jgi:predicted alpha/beta-fold hydrolase
VQYITTDGKGYDVDAPIMIMLHGLNGGSSAQYIISAVKAAVKDGFTVVVFITRGCA